MEKMNLFTKGFIVSTALVTLGCGNEQTDTEQPEVPIAKVTRVELKDQPLTGHISGEPWAVVDVKQRITRDGYKAFGKKPDKYGMSDAPQIIWNKELKETETKQFSLSDNMTIHIPPGDNWIISEGIYKTKKTAKGYRVFVAFDIKDDVTEIDTKMSGYFDINTSEER